MNDKIYYYVVLKFPSNEIHVIQYMSKQSALKRKNSEPHGYGIYATTESNPYLAKEIIESEILLGGAK